MTVGTLIAKFWDYVKNDGFIVFSIAVFLISSIFLTHRLWFLQVSSESEIVITTNRGTPSERRIVLRGEEKKNFLRNSTQIIQTVSSRRGSILDRNGQKIAYSIPDANDRSRWQRVYSYSNSAPLIGYVKRDFFQRGLAGIEGSFDSYLSGEAGFTQYRRDGRGRLLPKLGRSRQRVQDGSDVHLTIDLDIQKIVDDVLSETVNNSRAKGGMAIVMDPFTGEIYAMSSYPTFDPIRRNTIEKNRAIAVNYEPGSIFKTITFAAAINEGMITPDMLVDCQNGVFHIPNERPITDPRRMGVVPFSDAFKYSSNIASLKIVTEKLGNRLFHQYMTRFGIGARTGIRLNEEERGIFNPLETWRPRDAMSMSFGNAVSTTLLQMAVMTSAIANGGFILRPQIHRKITDRNGRIVSDGNGRPQRTERFVVRQAISEETARTMRELMSDVVNQRGTGRLAAVEGLNIGGKTGTSRKVDPRGGYLDGHYWASFTGIAPIDRPALVVVVTIDDPREGLFGGVVAATAVAKMLTNIVASPKINIGKEINLFKDSAVEIAAPSVVERRVIPNFVKLDLRTARRIANEMRIETEVLGNGQTVISQSPRAGTEIGNFAKITLRTDSLSLRDEIWTMPNLVGTNVADAIDMLQQRGITPVFVEDGVGRIRRQHPTVGTVLEGNVNCSLFVERSVFEI